MTRRTKKKRATVRQPRWARRERRASVRRGGRIRRGRARLLDKGALEDTLRKLSAEGRSTPDEVAQVESELALVRSDSVYVLRHLGAHLGIGGLRATVPFLPLGSVLRASWVAGWRLYEQGRGHPEHARVHSLRVFLVSLVPFPGYLAYLVPLRSLHPKAAWIYANHVSFMRSERSLDNALVGKPRSLQHRVTWIASPPPRD